MPQPLMVSHPPARPWVSVMDMGRRTETNEDRHVMAKHRMVIG